jgi:hypothetical protein
VPQWQDSRSTDKRHVHTPLPDGHGRNICSSCWQVVSDPIFSSDDPRLKGAGLLRSGDDEDVDFEAMSLPDQLMVMYENYPNFHHAPYISIILAECERRQESEPWVTHTF